MSQKVYNPGFTESKIKHVKAWKHKSPVERAIQSLQAKRQTRVLKILKCHSEIKEIDKALVAMKSALESNVLHAGIK